MATVTPYGLVVTALRQNGFRDAQMLNGEVYAGGMQLTGLTNSPFSYSDLSLLGMLQPWILSTVREDAGARVTFGAHSVRISHYERGVLSEWGKWGVVSHVIGMRQSMHDIAKQYKCRLGFDDHSIHCYAGITAALMQQLSDDYSYYNKLLMHTFPETELLHCYDVTEQLRMQGMHVAWDPKMNQTPCTNVQLHATDLFCNTYTRSEFIERAIAVGCEDSL